MRLYPVTWFDMVAVPLGWFDADIGGMSVWGKCEWGITCGLCGVSDDNVPNGLTKTLQYNKVNRFRPN